jgi:hypothetical protein
MLINSLSLLFAFTDFITPLEALVLGLATFGLVYWLTPPPQNTYPALPGDTLYAYLQASWLGRLPLSWVFWPFFAVFNAMLFYIDDRAINGTFTLASWLTMHIIFAMPVVYWTGAVWRCSEHCRYKFWVVCARFLTVAAFYDYLLRLALYLNYPQLVISCGEFMIKNNACWE